MWMIFVGALVIGLIEVRTLDVRVEAIPSSSGLYYQHQEEARLCNSEWIVVTYLDLEQASKNLDVVGTYIDLTIGFCKKHDKSLWLNLAECRTTIRDSKRKSENLKGMRDLVSQLTRRETVMHRERRGLFNFIGQVSHSLFGTLDSENEEFCNQKISQLEGDRPT
jgi:hypothetical protein